MCDRVYYQIYSVWFNLAVFFRATVSAKNLSHSSDALENTKNVKLQRALKEMEFVKDCARRNNNHIQSTETSQTVVIAKSYTTKSSQNRITQSLKSNCKSEDHVHSIIHEKCSPTIKRVTRSMKTINETSHASSNVIKRVTRSMLAKDESSINTTNRLTRSKAKKLLHINL